MLLSRLKTGSLLFLFALFGCIEEYDTQSIFDMDGNLVVAGWVTNLPGKQTISVSKATPLQLSYERPVMDCMVEVQDDLGTSYFYKEGLPGEYFYNYSEGELEVGRAYRLRVITPEGSVYESEYEEMMGVPEIDSVYYEVSSIDTREPGEVVPGINLYTDFSADEESPDFYKVEVVETYGFNTIVKEAWMAYRRQFTELPADSIREFCYITEKVPDIVLISTQNLQQKKVPKFPVDFISNQTQRLRYGYSAEVRVLSLSPAAYEFWNNQKDVIQESGGLFETQPPSPLTNISNIEDPDEEVLGYFGASGANSKRVFVERGVIEEFDIIPYCLPAPVDMLFVNRLIRYGQGVAYFTYWPDGNGSLALSAISRDCFDCTSINDGVVEKPDFWPN